MYVTQIDDPCLRNRLERTGKMTGSDGNRPGKRRKNRSSIPAEAFRIFPLISGRFLFERTPSQLEVIDKKSEDFPIGILLLRSIDFWYFLVGTGPYFLTGVNHDYDMFWCLIKLKTAQCYFRLMLSRFNFISSSLEEREAL